MPISFPKENQSLKKQTELSSISDEEFKAAYTPPKFSFGDRLIQILFFIFGLGWLRLAALLVSAIIYLLIATPAHAFSDVRGKNKFILSYISAVTSQFIRVVLFCFGVWWVKVNGEFEPTAAVITYNHTTILDGPVIFFVQQFVLVILAGIQKVPFFGQICNSSGAIFIDRSKTMGNSKVIEDSIEQSNGRPVAIAPEGKTSNGSVLFKFRTGAFLTQKTIQPVVIRYTVLFGCGGITLNWIVGSFFEWLWLALCVPFAKVELTFLEPLRTEVIASKTPNERAEIVQLQMANALGIKAIDRSSKEIFNPQPIETQRTDELKKSPSLDSALV